MVFMYVLPIKKFFFFILYLTTRKYICQHNTRYGLGLRYYFTTDHAEEVLFHLFIITINESEKSVNI